MRKILMFLMLSLMLASPLSAKKSQEEAVVADTPEKFELLVLAIRQEMAPGKRYEFLSRRNRDTVNHQLDLMQQMLVKAGSVSNMSDESRVKLFSMQEEVNGILARNAEDRLVCTHVAPVGSHIPKTICHTVRELAASKRDYESKANRMINEQLAVDAASRTSQ
ncbi:hypothetical protein [Dokdonella sp.]|uniref:hypothetical protein n=1 Tax=Dokdonella sp. TaxID=2291710 RepID=UPI003C57B6F2